MAENKLGALLRTRRLAAIDPLTGRSYTQAGLGEAVGVSGKTITAIETGEVQSVAPGTASALSRVLGLTVAEVCRAMGYEVESARLTEQESDVIQILRRLPDDRRAILIEMLRGAARGALST